MSKSSQYLVSINEPEGLTKPHGENRKEIARLNGETIARNVDVRVAQLETAGILEGITIHAKMGFLGCLSVNGPEDKIENLKHYLNDNNIGDLYKDIELTA